MACGQVLARLEEEAMVRLAHLTTVKLSLVDRQIQLLHALEFEGSKKLSFLERQKLEAASKKTGTDKPVLLLL